jgi:hypothetical protein
MSKERYLAPAAYAQSAPWPRHMGKLLAERIDMIHLNEVKTPVLSNFFLQSVINELIKISTTCSLREYKKNLSYFI